MYRVVAAFLISPLAPMLLAGVASIFLGADRALLGPAMYLTAFYAYPAALVIGVPLFLYAKRRHWLRWWQVTLQAAVIGGAVPLLVLAAIATLGGYGWSGFATAADIKAWAPVVAIGIGLGCASGVLFSVILGAGMSGRGDR
jgi:hypothetical protein